MHLNIFLFRGRENEAAYALENENLDHGNFLEILILLSKYDVTLKTFLQKVIKRSKSSSERGNKQRTGNFLTFFSKTTVNSIISVMTSMIKEHISKEITEAGMYSIEIDTTQDISTTDQCSVIIRLVIIVR